MGERKFRLPWNRPVAEERESTRTAQIDLRRAEVGLAQDKLAQQDAIRQQSKASYVVGQFHMSRKINHYGLAIEEGIEAKYRKRHA